MISDNKVLNDRNLRYMVLNWNQVVGRGWMDSKETFGRGWRRRKVAAPGG